MRRSVFRPKRNGKVARLYRGRIKLDSWHKVKEVPLHTSDKRVAEQQLEKLVQQFEREEAGIAVPQALKDAALQPLEELIGKWLEHLATLRRADNSIRKYRSSVMGLCRACNWSLLRDVTEASFHNWRSSSKLKPKTLNDWLTNTQNFLNWMERQRLLIANPLKHLQKVANITEVAFRRSLTLEEMQSLLAVTPFKRAAVYQAVFYLGLRRNEVNSLKWGDVSLDPEFPTVRIPATVAKNRRETRMPVHSTLADTLNELRPERASANDYVFRGHVPRVPTLKRDLGKAGIAFEDERGCRADLHALRNTFITQIQAHGADPHSAMKAARHSDQRLTLQTYTDPKFCKMRQVMDLMPDVPLKADPQIDPQIAPQPGVTEGLWESSPDTQRRIQELSELVENELLRHEKAPTVTSRRLSKMERAKRFELSTVTLARWRSTN